ncbi:ANTAR domain-containing protein [Streptomyces sp. TS71-3]|uniref:ANTAR domain-containing protein n=1 Tax=Streptomyces sp. TS71-3 TaxID=2733862 RepID=UPI001BB3430E|nr:ANTAR domain-containing protein [Streptomyces sp. TS71-3]
MQEDDCQRVIAALQQEVAQMKEALVSHAVVDQAIGVVVTFGGVRPQTGWDVLKEVSQHTNTKLREVAEYLVRWPHCLWLPPDIRHTLDAALVRRDALLVLPAQASSQPPSRTASPAAFQEPECCA